MPRALLRRHVHHRALDGAGLGLLQRKLTFGNAKVDDFDLTEVTHQHVVRVDVAVNEPHRRARQMPGVVRKGQAGAQLRDDFYRVGHGQQAAGVLGGVDNAPQALALHILHGDVVHALGVAYFVNLHNVGVVELRGNARLGEEHIDVFLLLLAVV